MSGLSFSFRETPILMRRLVYSTLCLMALQAGCSQDLTWDAVHRMIAADFPDVPSITTDSLSERLSDASVPSPVLLDARSAEEFAVSHLPGAHRVDPAATTVPALDTLSRDTAIVVYCSVGYRSARIAHRLRTRGFTNVSNLKGSIFRWANEGRPVYRDGRPVTTVHPYNTPWGHLLADSLHAEVSRSTS